MFTNKQIIDNQTMFKDEIINYFIKENKNITKDLLEINSNDEFILKEKEKMISKLKKTNVKDSINKYFFSSPNRDENFYAWWDVNSQEARILKYVQK
jgi:hypothetical protein